MKIECGGLAGCGEWVGIECAELDNAALETGEADIAGAAARADCMRAAGADTATEVAPTEGSSTEGAPSPENAVTVTVPLNDWGCPAATAGAAAGAIPLDGAGCAAAADAAVLIG